MPLLLTVSLMLVSLTLSAQWKGKITFNYPGSVKEFNLATKTEKLLLTDAAEPFVSANGSIYFINEKFQKRYKTVRATKPPFIQVKDVLDLSPENPKYKKELEEYSIIRGTGKSDVMDRITDPEVSPDGKYLAVTIFGWGDQVFNKNCVAIYDLASGELLTKFDEKYGGTWTPDGRLVMTGSHKTVSIDGNEYHSKQPGIFITNQTFSTISRIDPELDDPAPYHPSVSPDGKRIAFIINNHVWVMNIDGSNLKQLTTSGGDNIETFPQWSPDGKYVAAWSYKTFEKSYFTALAIVPANAANPVALTNNAAVWPRDAKKFRLSGGSKQFSWKL